MGNSDFCLWTFVAVLLSTIIKIKAAGNFELQILEISNVNSHLQSGYCCSVPLSLRTTKTTDCPPCSTAFRLCLKEHQTTQTPDSLMFTGCSFGNASTSVLGGSSFVLPNPEVGSIVLPFTFRWTKLFTLVLQAVDFYNTTSPISEDLIIETTYSGLVLPSPEWNTLDDTKKNAHLTYRVRVQCAPNYYNTTCTTFCRPRDDKFGHYTCGHDGNKVCRAGWQGSTCEHAICKPGCDPNYGKCERPGECDCRIGWHGPLCNECTVYPGCRHGYCNGSAWQCICDTNWGGILCDQDLNFCGTHEPCMHGGTCENTAPDQFRCTCADGLSGSRCEIVEHPCATQPCGNGGTCTLKDPAKYEANQMKNLQNEKKNLGFREMRGGSSMGKPVGGRPGNQSLISVKPPPTPPAVAEFICSCLPGWTGPTCEINIDECAGGPCEHGGTCIDLVGGFRCECPPQWTGEVCHIDVDECESNPASTLGPCINAQACLNTPGAFHCTCLPGWGGATCAKDLDDCVGQCRHGATCIDLVNSYHCACASGYTGRDCATDINECANSPCQNGGECVDLVGNFKCICPVGYSGHICEINNDHCTPSPCVEGKCLNTQEGYYCHCPPYRTGKHCENISKCDPPSCNDGCSPPTNISFNNNNQIQCSAHGKCETTTNGSKCLCSSGFTGTYCEHNLDDCSPNPCKNGGICSDGDGDYSCNCPKSWSGKNCTELVTQCQAGQCLNGGSCIQHGATSQCRCASGWNGAFCADPVDQCEGQPCHNGGTCESGTGWFRCICAKGFSGPDCRINVNECSPQPCLGGATCKDGIGGFTCLCPPGRKGNRCEILLSDPSSVCLNTSTLSPYNPLTDPEEKNHTIEYSIEETNCNACICYNGQPKCSNLWCGLDNCLAPSTAKMQTKPCGVHEVCVPATQETCLSPPCEPRGDCRTFEQSKRVAPPKLPASIDCWPNQATLGELCSRISILLESNRMPKKSSVEGICFNLRTLLASRIVRISRIVSSSLLVLLCDLKTGTNDTIEITVSTPAKEEGSVALVAEAVKLLGELLSRQNGHIVESFALDQIEAASLSAILEVKVETALITSEPQGSGVFFILAFVIAIAALCIGAFGALLWRKRISERTTSGTNLSPTSNDEEKSNNLQNEENFRRYANPLKGSVTSLRGAMELSLTPAPEIASVVGSLAGPSAVHRSQPLYPPCDNDFNEKDPELNKQKSQQQQRGSQILLYKAQNPDMRKNTVGSIDSPHKDFGKRSINCQSIPPVTIDSDVLTVHV